MVTFLWSYILKWSTEDRSIWMTRFPLSTNHCQISIIRPQTSSLVQQTNCFKSMISRKKWDGKSKSTKSIVQFSNKGSTCWRCSKRTLSKERSRWSKCTKVCWKQFKKVMAILWTRDKILLLTTVSLTWASKKSLMSFKPPLRSM